MANPQYVEVGKLFFEEGLPGFSHLQFFRLLQEEKGSPFYSLESVEDPQVGFWVVDPFAFFADYEFELQEQAKASLHISQETPVVVLNIVTPRPNQQITVNLKAPIIVNQVNRMAKQVILREEIYDVRQPLLPVRQAASK
ncbi:flagellar assembly protein FliW [Brevibacillus massiliensis]|uniref:flagellar assembly protein FliW n=1 Tax=Brevibacillus massiliensis TaxID=1118054 RepID=UPI00031FCF0F|nr:flagellar assembly protein FliW [Brevibacillus massiliensis]